MGVSPKKPNIRNPDSPKEEKKRIRAEERLRRSYSNNQGTAANLLASKDVFGTSKTARTLLGGSDLLG
jgi:hypothetical protein